MPPCRGALLAVSASSFLVSSRMRNIMVCPMVGVMGRQGWTVPSLQCWSGLTFSVP